MRFSRVILPPFVFLLCMVSAQGQIINVEDKRAVYSDSTHWHETVQLGVNLVQNLQTILSVSGSAQLEFQYKNKLLLSLTEVQFVKAGDQGFVNEGFQHLRYNNKMNDWLTFELFGQVQYNEEARIKLRALAGSGLRFRILHKDDQRAYLGVTYMFEYDEESEAEIIHNDSRLSTYLSFSLKPADFVTLSSTSYYQPLFTEFADFRLSSKTSAIFAFNDRLSFRSTLTITYDSRAAVGAPLRILRLGNSLSYTF